MRNVIAFGWLWLGLIIQTTLFQVPPINVIQPNFVLVVLVIIALSRGTRASLVLGILIGFVQDVNYGSFIGLNAFAFGVIGYFAAATFAQFLHRNVVLTFLIAIVCTFIFEWITFGMTRLFGVTAFSWHGVLTMTFGQMIVNGITLLVLYPLLIKTLTSRPQPRYRQVNVD
jgi:rod shape-determining protein MreD